MFYRNPPIPIKVFPYIFNIILRFHIPFIKKKRISY